MFGKRASSFLLFSAAAEIAASPFLFLKAETSAADKSHTNAILLFFLQIPLFFRTLFKNHEAGPNTESHSGADTRHVRKSSVKIVHKIVRAQSVWVNGRRHANVVACQWCLANVPLQIIYYEFIYLRIIISHGCGRVVSCACARARSSSLKDTQRRTRCPRNVT